MRARAFPLYQNRYDRCPAPIADELVSSMQSRSCAHSMLKRERKGANRPTEIAKFLARIVTTRARVLAARAAVAAYGYGGWEPI